jgi:long-subunit fatty acid transport protein
MRRALWSAVFTAISWSFCGSAFADGVILNGVSAHTIGRGGTNIAHFDNGSVLHDNPAAMARMPDGTTFQIGVTGLITDFQYSDLQNDTGGQHQLYPLPELSIVRRCGCSPWTIGIGGFVPAGFGSIYNLEGPAPFSGTQQYKSFGSLTKLLPGVAYSVNDRLSVGATLGVAITVADLEGPYTLQGPSFLRGVPTLLDLDADGAALSWSVGLLYRVTDRTSVGLSYLSESRFEAEGTTRVVAPILGQSDYDTQLDITWPRSVGLGVRHQFCSNTVLSSDVIWYNWSKAFDGFGIHLDAPSNPQFPAVFEEFPLDWRDTVSVRVGAEQDLGCGRTLRLGYVYHRVPIPTSTITPYIPASLEHAFSIGYGWRWHCWNLNLAYMYTFGPTVSVENSGFVGGDFDQSEHRAETHAIGVSFMRRL